MGLLRVLSACGHIAMALGDDLVCGFIWKYYRQPATVSSLRRNLCVEVNAGKIDTQFVRS